MSTLFLTAALALCTSNLAIDPKQKESTCAINNKFNYGCPKWIPTNATTKSLADGERVTLTNANQAFCLDGSWPVMYFRSGSASNKFHIFFEGGGACVGLNTELSPKCFDSCSERSKGGQGSSNSYPISSNYDDEYMSTDPTINPLSYDWNTIYVKYCDGGMFLADRNEPVQADDNSMIYYRGRRIMIAVFESLINNFNFNAATDVLISGCSAGTEYEHPSISCNICVFVCVFMCF